MQTKEVRKRWWESKTTVLLKEYEKMYGGKFVAAQFKDFKYTGQYVRVLLAEDLGECTITLTEASSDSSNKNLVIGIKYSFRPRRKLEFDLFSAKRPAFALFLHGRRPTTLPTSDMNKRFQARSSHPSVFRSVLKQDGLVEALDQHPKAYVRTRIKENKATLTFTESCKNPDASKIEDCLKLVKLFIEGLQEQGVIYITH